MLHSVVVVNIVSTTFRVGKFCSVYLPTHIYYSETCRFQQHDDNSDFATLTFALAAAADKLFRLIVISRQKMVGNIANVC